MSRTLVNLVRWTLRTLKTQRLSLDMLKSDLGGTTMTSSEVAGGIAMDTEDRKLSVHWEIIGAGVAEALADEVAGAANEDVAEKSAKTGGWTLLW